MRSPLLPLLGLALLLAACAREEARRKVGDPLGDHVLQGIGDVRLATSGLGPRVLLLHFFEPDSEACRAQVAQIRDLWFPHRAAGMSVLAVSPGAGAGEVAQTAKEWSLPYPVFLDPERKLAGEFAPQEYPWNVVVGRDGRILLTERGSWDRVQAAVREAIRAEVAGPPHVRVQHVLVAFDGSLPGKSLGRSREEAAQLAAELLARARAGEDFDALVKAYSADAAPGVYPVANFNVPVEDDFNEAARGDLVPSFGDVAFSLEVGGIGMAEYHPIQSRFGWHIIKRLR